MQSNTTAVDICSDQHQVSVRRQFVYQGCIYFSTNEKTTHFGEFCYQRQTIPSSKEISIQQIFNGTTFCLLKTSLIFITLLGLVARLDAAVQILIQDLPNFQLLLDDSSISSIVIISFIRSRQILFHHQNNGQVSSGSDDFLKKARAYFTGNGTRTVDLFDANLLIRSLAYDRFQKRLYLLKPETLIVFDLTTRKWNNVQMKSDLKKKIVNKEGSSSLSTEKTLSTQIMSILFANRQLYAQVDSEDKLSPIEMQKDGQTGVLKSDFHYTWKDFFNCYQKSPLVLGDLDYNVDGKKHQQFMTTKRAPIKPLEPIQPPNTGESHKTNHAVVIIIVIVVALILFCGAIVYCKYFGLFKLLLFTQHIFFSSIVSIRALLAAKESTSDAERARDLERQFKLDDLTGTSATTGRSKSLVSPVVSRRSSLDSPQDDSHWTLRSFVRNIFGQKKSTRQRRRKMSSMSSTSLSLSDRDTPTNNSSDYSSKLSLFNPSSINISRGMATIVSGTSMKSHRRKMSHESLKTIRISSNCPWKSSPVEPVEEVPYAELPTRRLFKISYAISRAQRPGGFVLRTLSTRINAP